MSSPMRPASGRGPAQDGDRLRRRHATALRRRDDPEAPVDPADDEVVGVDLDRLAGLDDRARRRARRCAPSSADHEPRSDQPTSIAAITTWPSRAAPSITA